MGGAMVGMSTSNKLVLSTSVDEFDTMELSLVYNSNENFYLVLPWELEHPPVSVIVYCSYLVQAESATVVVLLEIHCFFMSIDVFPEGFP